MSFMQTVSSRDLLSVAVQLAEKAGQEIMRISKRDDIRVEHKNEDPTNLVTEADKKAAALIEGGFRKTFPEVRLICEEDQITPQTPGSFRDRVDYALPPMRKWGKFPIVAADRLAIFVDPLDGTYAFVHGAAEHVSVLIGVTLDGAPFLGAVHFPFRPGRPVYFGAVGIGVSESVYEDAADLPPHAEELRITTTTMECDDCCSKAIDAVRKFRPVTLLRHLGAGSKITSVFLGLADAYLYPRPGLSVWDVCAGDAIIKALGGEATDAAGKPLPFCASCKIPGYVCAMPAATHAFLIRVLRGAA